MATIRLTKEMRRDIRRRLLDHRFKVEEEALELEKRAFGDEVYNTIYDEKTRKAMAALPAGFLPYSDDLPVEFVSVGEREIGWGESRPVAEMHRYNSRSSGLTFSRTHPLTRKFNTLRARSEALTIAKRRASEEINAVLNSVSTLHKLLEVWPEITPFAEHLLEATTIPNLPAVELKQLTALLNLRKS